MIKLDQPVPHFTVPATGDHTFDLSTARGNPVVLFFYPKDLTPGCTIEAEDFRDLFPEFQKIPCPILGISRDSLESHEKFIQRKKLPFPLLSDSDGSVCAIFEVIKDKNIFGVKTRGIERSTFLIDSQGILRREWRAVSITGHAQEVLEAARAL